MRRQGSSWLALSIRAHQDLALPGEWSYPQLPQLSSPQLTRSTQNCPQACPEACLPSDSVAISILPCSLGKIFRIFEIFLFMFHLFPLLTHSLKSIINQLYMDNGKNRPKSLPPRSSHSGKAHRMDCVMKGLCTHWGS